MSRYKRVADYVNLIMITMLVCEALYCVTSMVFTDQDFLAPIGVFAVLLLSYLSRVFVEQLWVYIISHLITPILSIVYLYLLYQGIIPAGERLGLMLLTAALWCFMAFLMLIVDLAFWSNAVNMEKNLPVSEDGSSIAGFRPIFKEGLSYVPVPFVLLFIIGMIYGTYMQMDIVRTISYVCGILYVGMHLIRSYLMNISEFIGDTRKFSSTPMKKMLGANAKITVPLIVLFVVAMFLLQSDALVSLIDRGIAALIDLIRRFVAYLFTHTDDELPIRVMESAMGDMGGEAAMVEPPPFWLQQLYRALETILSILLAGGMIALIVYSILKFVRNNKRRSINRPEEMVSAEMTEVRERLYAPSHAKSQTRGKRDEREQIRYLYKKMIRRFVKKGYSLNTSDTPIERIDGLVDITYKKNADIITEDMGPKQERMVNITELYDMARYSDMPVSQENVREMEKLL